MMTLAAEKYKMTRLAKTIVSSFVSHYSVQCTIEGIQKSNILYFIKGIIIRQKWHTEIKG